MISSPISLIQQALLPFGEAFTEHTATTLLGLRADERTQSRVEELAEKSREGQITPEELAEYKTYADVVSVISLLQAKARLFLRQQGHS